MAASPISPVIFSFFLPHMIMGTGWSRSALSWALTFRMVASGATAPLLGPLIDRVGPRWLGVLAGLVVGGSLIGLAVAHNLMLVYLLFAISGAVGLGGGPGGNLLTSVTVAKWFIAKRGRAMGIATVGMAGGTVIGIPVTQWLIQTTDWRLAWIVLGVAVCILVIPLSILFMRRAPEDMGLLPDGTSAMPVSASRAEIGAVEERDWTVREALHTPTLWVILAAFGSANLALSGTLVYRVGFWQDIGLSPVLVAVGTAADPFTVIFSALVFGMIGERVPSRHLSLIFGSGFAISMLPMVFTTGGAFSLFAHNIIWGAAAGSFITVNNLIWPDYFGRRSLGAIRGIALPLTIVAAGLSAPLYGYILDLGVSPRIVWTLSLTLFLVAGGLLGVTRPPRRQPVRTAASPAS